MNITLERASEADANLLLELQARAFLPLLEKYQDTEHNPANETLERMLKRISNPKGCMHKIWADGRLAGAIGISWREEPSSLWIGPLFVDPALQGQGIARQAMDLAMALYPEAAVWGLATLLEEERNCRLYEKMGFTLTDRRQRLNERATLVFYERGPSN